MSKLELEMSIMPKWRQDNIIHNYKVNGHKALRSRYKIIMKQRYVLNQAIGKLEEELVRCPERAEEIKGLLEYYKGKQGGKENV